MKNMCSFIADMECVNDSQEQCENCAYNPYNENQLLDEEEDEDFL